MTNITRPRKSLIQKLSTVEGCQTRAILNIRAAICEYLARYQTIMELNPKDSVAYQKAMKKLGDHEKIVKRVYKKATTDYYFNCGYYTDSENEMILNAIRSCGEEWLLEMIEKEVKSYGY